MGCDIHIILEKKFEGKWIGIQEASHVLNWVKKEGEEWKEKYIWIRATERDYEAFGKLAGVRRPGPEPKGVPEDASELTLAFFKYWGRDGHSHSWCSLKEFFEIKLSTIDNPAEVFLGSKHPAITHPMGFWFGMYEPEEGDEERPAEEYRVVFCFDN